MDEALALKLYEEECRTLEREINAAEYSSNAFAHMRASRDDEREKQLLGAHSFADFEDYEEYYEEVSGAKKPALGGEQAASALAPTAASSLAKVGLTAPKSKSTPTPFTGMKKQPFDRSHQIESAGKGFNSIRESMRKQQKNEEKGLSGRVEAEKHATRNGVLDERTERILQKMINRAELDEVHGCIQTGKEAHVYHAVGTDQDTMRERQFAVKVFKTTLNEFSNRGEYVTGDRRFDLHYEKKSMRRQMQVWTEKEFRNLCRAAKHIRAPQPFVFKEHVLVMDFIGENGWPAPTLKDADLTEAQLGHAYADILQAVRTLYQEAHLVHADLSEYNILFYKQRCWIIDFGQATDRTHQDCEEYLKRDLFNVHRFFQRAGLPEANEDEVGLLSEEAALEFVLSDTPDDIVGAFPPLKALLKKKRTLA
ncbi:Atypical/rio protein kinase, partial [Globisporangium splendens]